MNNRKFREEWAKLVAKHPSLRSAVRAPVPLVQRRRGPTAPELNASPPAPPETTPVLVESVLPDSDEERTAPISVMVSPAEKALMQRHAKEAGLSLSTWARRKILTGL